MHGESTFSGGGAVLDVIDMSAKYGIVPEEAYKGLDYGFDNHDHLELDAALKGYLDGVLAQTDNKKRFQKLSSAWQAGLNGILDAYFGKAPEKFTYNGVEYTPQSFAKSLGLDMSDYINISSYTHHPFYSQFVLEVQDNWAWGLSYNVPMDDMMSILDNALANGYSVAWAADVSEKGFGYQNGVAIVPEASTDDMNGTELSRWVALSEKDKEAELYKFEKPGKEKAITQEMRQEAFDNFETTDDHGMVFVGRAKDQLGNEYYKVKNSWDNKNVYKGFFYASRPYVSYKTMNLLVHKDAIPAEIKTKMGIE